MKKSIFETVIGYNVNRWYHWMISINDINECAINGFLWKSITLPHLGRQAFTVLTLTQPQTIPTVALRNVNLAHFDVIKFMFDSELVEIISMKRR